MLYDISPPLSAQSAAWPGDLPFVRETRAAIANGDAVNLSALHTTLHIGAHVDAPRHVRDDALAIDAIPLDVYVGPCQVLCWHGARHDSVDGGPPRVYPDDFQVELRTPRVLLALQPGRDRTRFDPEFPAPAPELIDWLHARGVRLLGLDTPSVDRFRDTDLPVHHRMIAHHIAILEGVLLDAVPEGIYELIALPLRLSGADGSPVRAVLRSL